MVLMVNKGEPILTAGLGIDRLTGLYHIWYPKFSIVLTGYLGPDIPSNICPIIRYPALDILDSAGIFPVIR